MFGWFRSAQLDRIESKLNLVLMREKIQMAQQDDIKAAMDVVRRDLEKQTTVVAGMSVYVAGIQKKLVDMANTTKDTETANALMSFAQQIESNTKADADAMASNLTGITPAQAGIDPNAPKPTDPVAYNSAGGVWKDGDGAKYDISGKAIVDPVVKPEPNPFNDPNAQVMNAPTVQAYNASGGVWKDGDGLKFDINGKPL